MKRCVVVGGWRHVLEGLGGWRFIAVEMYAYVHFLKDGVKRVVHRSDIKDFFPKNVQDFDPSLPVKVLWRGFRDEIPTSSAERYKGLILKLGGEAK